MHLALLELMYLGPKVVNYVVSVCERYSMILHLLLHVLDLQVLRGLELLKLTGLKLGSFLGRPRKDTVPK
jgi:hypothetical protein